MSGEREPDDLALLSAYVDGVTELTADERRRVEARLNDQEHVHEGVTRADADATRALIGQLRGLPAEGGEPDWGAMESAIRAEVGPDVPRPWWRPRLVHWLVPIGALAIAGAVLALVVHTPASSPVTTPQPPVVPARDERAVTDDESIPLWLDGAEVEVDPSAAALLDALPADSDATDEAWRPDGLLPAGELAWVDELSDEDIMAAEAWLARKKS